MKTLEAIDRSIVLAINGMNSPLMDEVMWIVSGRLTWFPLYLFLIYLFYKIYGVKKTACFLICAVATVALADLISVHFFKNVFERYRPSHHALLTEKLHFYTLTNGDIYKGGQFGFVSSHATNYLAIATFSFLAMRKKYKFLLPLLAVSGVLILYSRIYLGVHYLSDVFVGGLLGFGVAFLMHRFVFIPILKKI
jgi:undecaprenyl-diphosphatase